MDGNHGRAVSGADGNHGLGVSDAAARTVITVVAVNRAAGC